MDRMIIATAFAGLVLASQATEYHVYSDVRDGMTGNQQLTNAFAQAANNDTITIHAGTYNLATEEMMYRFETDANRTPHATAGVCLYSKAAGLPYHNLLAEFARGVAHRYGNSDTDKLRFGIG